MRKLLLLPFLTIISFCNIEQTSGNTKSDENLTPLSVIENAFKNNQSGIQVEQEGVLVTVLSDDNDGDRHQRLIVELSNGQTLLITHNIDIAPRVPSPSKGKSLKFYGEYEWNSEGGVVHWTHKDPQGQHINGWLEYDGKRYE
jgi:hypothetical protein